MDKHVHDIEKYLKGELSPAEMHALEKQALDDPFLAEALEGAEQLTPAIFSNDVSDLNTAIRKQRSTRWTGLIRIAASLLLLALTALIIWTMRDNETENLALNQPVPETQTVTPETQTQPASPTADTQPETSASDQTSSAPITPSSTETQSEPGSKPEQTTLQKEPRVTSLPRSKGLEHKVQPVTIDPLKRNELQPPSVNNIRITEGYIAAVDARPTIVTGLVLSAEDGTPLPDVNIAVKGTTLTTKTDAYGRYAITTHSQNKTLVYASEGLESTEVKIEGVDSTYLPVKMEMDEEAQKEAVVEPVGLFDSMPTHVYTIPAHPENGNRAFKQYLQENVQYPEEARNTRTEGTVVVEFKVDAKGVLSEFRVIRGIGKGCDEELIRLILQGDKWKPTTRDGIPVSDKARVRFKFTLQ